MKSEIILPGLVAFVAVVALLSFSGASFAPSDSSYNTVGDAKGYYSSGKQVGLDTLECYYRMPDGSVEIYITQGTVPDRDCPPTRQFGSSIGSYVGGQSTSLSEEATPTNLVGNAQLIDVEASTTLIGTCLVTCTYSDGVKTTYTMHLSGHLSCNVVSMLPTCPDRSGADLVSVQANLVDAQTLSVI